VPFFRSTAKGSSQVQAPRGAVQVTSEHREFPTLYVEDLYSKRVRISELPPVQLQCDGDEFATLRACWRSNRDAFDRLG
jgi:hypothetical protein